MYRITVDPPTNASSRRRSQRVVLRVPLVLRTELADGRKLRVHAFSLVVNAHGGLLESPLMVEANHQIALVNPKTGKEAWCRVIRSECSSADTVSLAFEFHEPTATDFGLSAFHPKIGGRSTLSVTSHISMALLTLSFGTYLLVIGVGDDGPAADLLVLVGAVLFATGLFLFGFTIKNFLLVRRVRLHVKGIKRLISTTSSRAN